MATEEGKRKIPRLPKLEPSKETLNKLPSRDRFAYAGIFILIAFVLIISVNPPSSFNPMFWILIVVIIVVGIIIIANIFARREVGPEAD